MPEFSDLPLIIIQSVSIRHDIGDIRKIKLDGTKNIFTHPKVVAEIKNGGKVITIEGVIRYTESEFDFSIGHTIGSKGTPMTHIFVARKTGEGNSELVPEVYAMLFETYQSIFN